MKQRLQRTQEDFTQTTVPFTYNIKGEICIDILVNGRNTVSFRIDEELPSVYLSEAIADKLHIISNVITDVYKNKTKRPDVGWHLQVPDEKEEDPLAYKPLDYTLRDHLSVFIKSLAIGSIEKRKVFAGVVRGLDGDGILGSIIFK